MGYIMELRKMVGSRPLIMVGSCVLVVDDSRRLLLQRRTDNGLWGLSGGSLEPGETLEEAAKRELYAAYICTAYSGDLHADVEEVQELRYFHETEIPEEIHPPDRSIIQAFFKAGGNP